MRRVVAVAGQPVGPLAGRSPGPAGPTVDLAGGQGQPGSPGCRVERARQPHGGRGGVARHVEGGDEGDRGGLGVRDHLDLAGGAPASSTMARAVAMSPGVDIDAQDRQDLGHAARLYDPWLVT